MALPENKQLAARRFASVDYFTLERAELAEVSECNCWTFKRLHAARLTTQPQAGSTVTSSAAVDVMTSRRRYCVAVVARTQLKLDDINNSNHQQQETLELAPPAQILPKASKTQLNTN